MNNQKKGIMKNLIVLLFLPFLLSCEENAKDELVVSKDYMVIEENVAQVTVLHPTTEIHPIEIYHFTMDSGIHTDIANAFYKFRFQKNDYIHLFSFKSENDTLNGVAIRLIAQSNYFTSYSPYPLTVGDTISGSLPWVKFPMDYGMLHNSLMENRWDTPGFFAVKFYDNQKGRINYAWLKIQIEDDYKLKIYSYFLD